MDCALPIIVGGRRIEKAAETVSFDYRGCRVTLPAVPEEEVRALFAKRFSPLLNVSIDDIVLFFDKVGRNWRDPDNVWSRKALELSAHTVGYAASTVSWDINFIGGILQRQKLYDLIENDLGDAGLLDEFTRHKAVNRKCLPLGRLLNVLVGNVPIASFISILRSLCTKNETICKLPSRDVVSGLCFANCIYDTDPEHPVAQALTCGYWPAGGPLNDFLFEAVDGVVVWGKGETIAKVRRQTPSETPIIEFGPKRSLAIVDLDAIPIDRHEAMARRVAYDICTYDQEACFSVQQLFCVGAAPAPFLAELEKALATYDAHLPARTMTLDESYHVVRARAEAAARADRLRRPEHSRWTIVETEAPRRILDHPLGRTVYVHHVARVEDVLAWMDRSVQTVSYEPYDKVAAVADALAAAGADRIVRSGRHGRFRPGVSQDGLYGMHRLVRWVSWERDLDHKYRFMSADAGQDEQNIYYKLMTKAE